MSAKEQRTETGNGFASEGHADYIDFHLDAEKFIEIAKWSLPSIQRELAKYAAFMSDTNVLPAHLDKAAVNSRRLQFEVDYRDGKYDTEIDDLSELEAELASEIA